MLTRLLIRNFGLIDEVVVDLGAGLNILTGETGAGKSILIEALRVALGGRLTSTHIRDPHKTCLIEAVFELSDRHDAHWEEFADYFADNGTELILQRVTAPDGRAKVRINGLSATVAALRRIGRFLVDFHGAHDHQLLLSDDQHIRLLDRLVRFGSVMTDYQTCYAHYTEITQQWRQLQELAQTRDRELDMLRHQVGELEQVPLTQKDFDQTKSDLAKIDNLERLGECLEQMRDLFENDDYGISRGIRRLFSPLRTLTQTDPTTAPLQEQLDQFQAQGDDLSSALTDYADDLALDPAAADEIRMKADQYDNILRKYGPGLAEAHRFLEKSRKQLDLLTDLDHNDAQLRLRREELHAELITKAEVITHKRRAAARQLKKTIEKELRELGIADVTFECRLQTEDVRPDGAETVRFYISPNVGFEPKPLADIVSSGEAARVMLALKKALIKVDPIPVLIFDEIDAQIGGRLGTVTGQKLRDLSAQRQVILITHLPQIASFADRHHKVIKTTQDGAAVTHVLLLDKDARIKEIAQMMSGQKQTEISLKHARDLMGQARQG